MVDDDTPVDEASLLCRGRPRRRRRRPRSPARRARRPGRSGAGVGARSRPRPRRRDDHRVPLVSAQSPLERMALRLAQDEIGWLPVVAAEPASRRGRTSAHGDPHRHRLAPVRAPEPAAEPAAPVPANLPGRSVSSASTAVPSRPGGRRRRASLLPGRRRRARPAASRAPVRRRPRRGRRRHRLRDRLATRLKGHVRPHEKFGTAIIVSKPPGGSTSTSRPRGPSPTVPGRAPQVEHAGIRSHLARRDFSMNAMAVSLSPNLRHLFDYFGGRETSKPAGSIVLRDLGFIEDPRASCARSATRAATGCAWTTTR